MDKRRVKQGQRPGVYLTGDDATRTITISHPERRNAMTYSMLEQLAAALEEVGEDDSAKVLVLRGDGHNFCSGADLLGTDESDSDDPEYFLDLSAQQRLPYNVADSILAWGKRTTQALVRLQVPTIAIIEGAAMGPGLSLALAADIAIGTSNAILSSKWLERALVPSFGDLWLLPRMIGLRRALDFVLMGREVSGEEAAELGMLSAVVEPRDVEDEAAKIVSHFANGPSVAFGFAKRGIYEGLDLGFEQSLRVVAHYEAENLLSDDVTEAFRAYAERRSARFRGM